MLSKLAFGRVRPVRRRKETRMAVDEAPLPVAGAIDPW
jgi:hypothetical protein